MNETELKKELKQGIFRRLYLLTGDEVYLRDYYAKMIRDAVVGDAFQEFNFHYYDSRNFRTEELADSMMAFPMMADYSMLYLKETGILKKAEPEKDFFAKLFQEIPEYMVVVLCESEADKIYAPYKAVKKYGEVIEFPYRTRDQLKGWIDKAVTSFGKNISDTDAFYLVDYCGPSMTNLKKELEKVIGFCGNRKEITRADLDATVVPTKEYQIFLFTDAIISGRADEAFRLLEQLKAQKEPALRLLVSISNFYSDILKGRILLDEGKSYAQAQAMLNAKGYPAKVEMSWARKIKEADLEYAAELCRTADRRIKAGEMDEWTALSVVVSECIRNNS